MMRFFSFPLFALLGVFAVTGLAQNAPRPVGIVFVAEGTGGQSSFQDNIAEAVRGARLPLQVVRVDWSQGSNSQDVKDTANQAVYARKLANRIMATHKVRPGTPMHLVGIGVGANVILTTAECLPYNSVSRIIVVAAVVPPTYDLRPALFASCEGIDSYSSNYDTMLIQWCRFNGFVDKSKKNVAGLSGFTPQIECHQDAALYRKLRQHRLEPLDPYTDGGHLGYYTPRFAAGHMLPPLGWSLGYRQAKREGP